MTEQNEQTNIFLYKMETIKLTQEELTKITEFRKLNDDLVWQFGQIETNIVALEQQKLELKSKFVQVNNDQNTFAKTLNTKYGDGTIRLETGEFVPVQN